MDGGDVVKKPVGPPNVDDLRAAIRAAGRVFAFPWWMVAVEFVCNVVLMLVVVVAAGALFLGLRAILQGGV